MDIDRFIARNQPAWERLEVLSQHAAGRKLRTLSGAEVEELVGLYQRASVHLAHARRAYREPGLLARLTMLVASAHAAIYGRRSRAGTSFLRFVSSSFPAAVWTCRRAILAAAVALLLPALAVGAWVANSDEALDLAIPEETQEALVASEFEDYYSSAPAASFSSMVTVNNIQVSVLSFALGFLLLPGIAILAYNGINIGLAGGLFVAEGQAGTFFGLILPHGLLELTAVVVAAGAGLQMGWALLVPGDRTRATALAEEGRRAVLVVLGTVFAFVVAGLIEGFVTPAPVPTLLRVAVGVVVEAAFLLWVLGRGRAAVAEGFTGLAEDDRAAWERRQLALATAAPSP
jgi:uncharacterized membrane protein SpoIIM required for sporulation